MEFHFTATAGPEQHALANMLAGALSDAWIARNQGIFTRHLAPAAPKHLVRVEDVLSQENPSRLSRAEYRVCMLLSNGTLPSDLSAELSISRSTLRSHLRNIYAKTGTENMPDLLYTLLKGRSARDGDAMVA